MHSPLTRHYQPISHFRQKRLQWRQTLPQNITNSVGHLQPAASNHADPLDRATQQEEMTLELRTRDREGKLIRKIDQTLERICHFQKATAPIDGILRPLCRRLLTAGCQQ